LNYTATIDVAKTKFEDADRILSVSDMAASVKYYEMHVEDPDGHVLRFGSEPMTDGPFANPGF
jgi:hypothetical protein